MRLQRWCLPALLFSDKVPQVPVFLVAALKLVCLPHLRSRCFQSVPSILDLRVIGFTHEFFKSRASFPCSSMIVLLLIPIGFQNKTFRWLIFPVPAGRVGVPDVGHNAFTS